VGIDRGFDTEALGAAFEAAMRAATDAAISTFRSHLRRAGEGDGKQGEAALKRYRAGSWKHDVLTLALQFTAGRENREFRFAEFFGDEELLRERHPDHKMTMSGVSVTLQGLIRDGVIQQVSRGLYRVV
jgi:hypothetical protein